MRHSRACALGGCSCVKMHGPAKEGTTSLHVLMGCTLLATGLTWTTANHNAQDRQPPTLRLTLSPLGS